MLLYGIDIPFNVGQVNPGIYIGMHQDANFNVVKFEAGRLLAVETSTGFIIFV